MTPGRHAVARSRSRWARRTTFALLAVGIASVTAGSVGLATASAADEPGSGFGSIEIGADAYGLRVPFYSHSGEDVESELPYSSSHMGYGGSGHALTSVFWPGGTGGHGGDTLKLLAGSCFPPDPTSSVPIPVPIPVDVPCVTQFPELPGPVYDSTNDTYKAEAYSGRGDPTVTMSHPGVDMFARAQRPTVRATTTIASAKLPGLDSVGTSTTDTVVTLTGPSTAKVDAIGVVRDVSLGGGAVKIQSIRSVAHAVTNGKSATGSASTIVNGMTVGGVPVTVDDKGVHIQGQGQKLPSLGALNDMLKQSGFSLYVADPSKTVKGASIQLFSGQLMLMQENAQYESNANDSGVLLTFGGASISADTSPAYVFDGGPVTTPTLPPTQPPPTGSSGSVSVPPAPSSGGAPPPAPEVATGQPTAQAPVLAAQRSPLPGGLSPWLIAAVVLGSGLIAAGLKRLPDEVLKGTGGICPLGEQS